jgi:dihydroorotate dehydrogenase (NAD+) catalytic subunit
MVWQVAKAVKLPIIGIGGIMNATDALEFILAGATAIQVGTASFINPGAAQQIAGEMEAWLVANNVADIKSLIGALET